MNHHPQRTAESCTWRRGTTTLLLCNAYDKYRLHPALRLQLWSSAIDLESHEAPARSTTIAPILISALHVLDPGKLEGEFATTEDY